jgi:hypothetical protein
MLAPWKHTLHAPNRVALYLFSDGSSVLENFNDEPVTAELDGRAVSLPARGWALDWR